MQTDAAGVRMARQGNDETEGGCRWMRAACGPAMAVQVLWRDEDAMTTTEYAIVLALIAIGALAAWEALGRLTGQSVESNAGRLASAGGSSRTCEAR